MGRKIVAAIASSLAALVDLTAQTHEKQLQNDPSADWVQVGEDLRIAITEVVSVSDHPELLQELKSAEDDQPQLVEA